MHDDELAAAATRERDIAEEETRDAVTAADDTGLVTQQIVLVEGDARETEMGDDS